jgi:hypothetical protein
MYGPDLNQDDRLLGGAQLNERVGTECSSSGDDGEVEVAVLEVPGMPERHQDAFVHLPLQWRWFCFDWQDGTISFQYCGRTVDKAAL